MSAPTSLNPLSTPHSPLPSLLIAGANGQVGTELARQARDRGCTVIAPDEREFDITCVESVHKVFDSYRPNIVINTAACTAVDKAEDEPNIAFAVNRDGALNLARACQQADIPLFHISTDYVFDGAKSEPYSEMDLANPLGVYGESKLAGDRVIAESMEKHIILRVSGVFGTSGNNFVKTMLRLAQERDELRVVADQHMAPTSASSIAACLLQLCHGYQRDGSLPWGLYHFTGKPYTSWHGFAEEILRQSREQGLLQREVKVIPISTDEYPTRAQRPGDSRLDTGKIESILGIAPPDWRQDLALVLGGEDGE